MKNLIAVDHKSRNVDLALLFVRIVIALLMFTHGIPKIANFSKDPVQFMNVMGMGPAMSLALTVFAEVFCSVLVLLGLATRLAVIPLIITMLVAAFHVHASDAFSKQEMSLHFLFVYVVLFILGSGKYSFDSLLLKRRQKPFNNPAFFR